MARKTALALAVLVGLIFVMSATAQQPAGDIAAQKSVVRESMSFAEIFKAGGWLMYPIAAASFIGVALIAYFLMVLRQEVVTPSRWLTETRELLLRGQLAQARELCEKKPSPASAITAAALDYVKSVGTPRADLLKEIIEGEGVRQATRIQNLIQYLLDIGVITPMIGLLGTVVGMLQAFNTVALDIAKAKPMLLAGGVSLALITTAGGLIVAIPAMIAYSFFRNRASTLTARLETVSADVLTILSK